MVKYAILGPVELWDGERRLPVGGPQQVALLAFLVLHANRAVSSDQLVGALWGEQRPAGAAKRLQVAIARLRKTLGLACSSLDLPLRTVADGYLLAVSAGELDAQVFQAWMQEGRRALDAGEPAPAAQILREALGLWRGPALAEVAHETFARGEIRRLDELRLAALETRIDIDMELGLHAALPEELEALVAEHPARERLAGQLMLALYRCARQSDALDVYRRTRARLGAELGLEPGPALKALQAKILEQSPDLELSADKLDRPISGRATSRDGTGARERSERAFELRAHASSPPGSAALESGAVRLPLPCPLQPPGNDPFVGRDLELGHLQELWTQVATGARAAVIVTGEAGIGKTRLSAELAGAVHAQGALVLYGRCDEGLAVPYQPFVEALRPYARVLGLDRLRAELGRLAPELGRLMPELGELGEPVRADPESERFALFEAVVALMAVATREQRALLIVDDLHWAANPTLLLLRHVIRSEQPLRALVLGTYRETELGLGQPLAQLLADLQRDASADHLSIRGLDEHAITALLEAARGRAPHEGTSQLVHALGAQTAGNPLFIRELLIHLVESGTIPHVVVRLSSGLPAVELEVPERLRQLISHRVARLSEPTRQALNAAAVAGSTFSLALLERVLGQDSDVLDALEQAIAAGLLVEVSHGGEYGDYAFAHALVRQTIYRGLGSARRMRLHRQFGEALEALRDVESQSEALAHHFAQAAADGQGTKAAVYALAAGRSATSRLGYEEAAGHYERGLKALTQSEQRDEQRRCELLLALSAARWSMGQRDKARAACLQAAELAERLGDSTALARAALGFGGPQFFEVGGTTTQPVVGLLERALAALSKNESALRARLMGRLAAALAHAGVEHRRPALARQALEMAHRVPDKAALADVLATSHFATRAPDNLDERLAGARELARVAGEIGDGRLRAHAHSVLLDHLLELGDIEAVEHQHEALRALAEGLQDSYPRWLLAATEAKQAHLAGRLEHCETLAREALVHGFEGHGEAPAQTFGVQMVFLRSEQGRLDELVETVEGFAAKYPEVPAWRCALAYVYAQLNRTAAAQQELEALARADFEDLPRDALWLASMSTLCEVVTFLGDAARAALLHRLLLPYADRCAVIVAALCQGSTSRPLALLATTMSRFEEAAEHFEEALTMNARIRSPLWLAHTQQDYAHMLLARGQHGDGDQALELLTAALTTAETLGLKALTDRTRPLRLHPESPSAQGEDRTEPSTDVLTTRR